MRVPVRTSSSSTIISRLTMRIPRSSRSWLPGWRRHRPICRYIKGQISGAGVATKPIAMTEWNIQATGSKQNTSYIAGMHAALTLGTFIQNGFGEASRWDLANGYANGDDMGMFNVGDEPNAPLWNPRPAFYYMYYFQRFFGDRMVYDTLNAAMRTWSRMLRRSVRVRRVR